MKCNSTKAACVTVLITVIASTSTAQAGFFDDIARKATEAADNIMKDVVSTPNKDQSSRESAKAAPPSYKKSAPVPESTRSDYPEKLVYLIQKNLNTLDYNAGRPDGLYGSGTRRAIKQYQRDQRLLVDGLPSKALLGHIRRTLETHSALAVSPKDNPVSVPVIKAKSQKVTRNSYSGNLDYPWEHVDIDMSIEQVDGILTDGGLVGEGRPNSNFYYRKYKGNWKGRWKSKVTIKVKRGVITQMNFGVEYPFSSASMVADYFSQVMPDNYNGTGKCERNGDEVGCGPLKDEALSSRRGDGYYHYFSVNKRKGSPGSTKGSYTMVGYQLLDDHRGYGEY